MVFHGKSDEVSIGPKAKFPHDAVFVKCDGPHRNTQDVGGLSHGLSFCQESHDFPLTRRKRFGGVSAPRIASGQILHLHAGDYRKRAVCELLADVTGDPGMS